MAANRQMKSMDEFAEHEGGGGKSERAYLSWKNIKAGRPTNGSVDVWMVDMPITLWRNQWHRIATFKEDGKERQKVASYNWNCMEESEDHIKALKRQGYYWGVDSADLARRKKPTVDPFLRLLEWIHGAVSEGAIDWLDVLFKYSAADSDDVVVHAGGMLRQYPKNFEELEFETESLKRKEIQRFKDAGVSLSESYRENAGIQLKYLFFVLENDKPAEGPKIAIEAEALGNCIKKLYQHRREKFDVKGRTKQEIAAKADLIKQVCLRWKFDNDKAFSDKYDLIELDTEPSDEVQEAFSMELPNVDAIVGTQNVAVLLENFKTHWEHEVTPPWDELFEPAFKAARAIEKERGLKEGTLTQLGSDTDRGSASEKSSTPNVGGNALPEDSGMVECEACNGLMPDDALTCPHCKVEYVQLEGGIICLKDHKCDVCGATWSADVSKCTNCGSEYGIEGDKFVVTKRGEPPKSEEAKSPPVRGSRRRITS